MVVCDGTLGVVADSELVGNGESALNAGADGGAVEVVAGEPEAWTLGGCGLNAGEAVGVAGVVLGNGLAVGGDIRDDGGLPERE